MLGCKDRRKRQPVDRKRVTKIRPPCHAAKPAAAAAARASCGSVVPVGVKRDKHFSPHVSSRLLRLCRRRVPSLAERSQQADRHLLAGAEGPWGPLAEPSAGLLGVPHRHRASPQPAAALPVTREALEGAACAQSMPAAAALAHPEIPSASTAPQAGMATATAAAAATAAEREDLPCSFGIRKNWQQPHQHITSKRSLSSGFSATSNSARRLASRYRQYVRKRLRRLQRQSPKQQQAKGTANPLANEHFAAFPSALAVSLKPQRSPLSRLSPPCSYFDEEDLQSDSECTYTPLCFLRADTLGLKDVSPEESLAAFQWQRMNSSCSFSNQLSSPHSARCLSSATAGAPTDAAAAETDAVCSEPVSSAYAWAQAPDVETPQAVEPATWGDCGGGALGLEICMLNAIEQSILLFNQRPEEGITHMQRMRLLENSPEAVATFLLVTDGLDRHLVAQVLGGSEARSVLLLRAFVSLLDLSDKDVEEALRHFCSFVPLSGEAQVVYRMLEMLSIAYKEANPESPLGAESVHVLLYALLILNTSLHNPVVKRSRQAVMTRALFCQMVEAAGVELSPETLGRLYSRIAFKELRTVHSVSEQIYIRLSREESANVLGEPFAHRTDSATSEGCSLWAGLAAAVSPLQRCDALCSKPDCSSSMCCHSALPEAAGGKGRERLALHMPQEGAEKETYLKNAGDTRRVLRGSAVETDRRMLSVDNRQDTPNSGVVATPLTCEKGLERDRPRAALGLCLHPAAASATSGTAAAPGSPQRGLKRAGLEGCTALCPHCMRQTAATGRQTAARRRQTVPLSAPAEAFGDCEGLAISGWAQEVFPDEFLVWQFVAAGPTDIHFSSRPPRSSRQQQQQEGGPRNFQGDSSPSCEFCRSVGGYARQKVWPWLFCRKGAGTACEQVSPRAGSALRCRRGEGLEASCCCGAGRSSSNFPVSRISKSAEPWPYLEPKEVVGVAAGNAFCQHFRKLPQICWTGILGFAIEALRLLALAPTWSVSSSLSLLLLAHIQKLPKTYARQRSRWGTVQVVQKAQQQEFFQQQQQEQQQQQQQQQQRARIFGDGGTQKSTFGTISAISEHAKRRTGGLRQTAAALASGGSAGPSRRCRRECSSGSSSSRSSDMRSSPSERSISRKRLSLQLGTRWLRRKLRAFDWAGQNCRVFLAKDLRAARVVPGPNGSDLVLLEFCSARVVLQLQQQSFLPALMEEKGQHAQQQQQQQQALSLKGFLAYLQEVLQGNAERERRLQDAEALLNLQQIQLEEQKLDVHWAVSGLALVLQLCPQLAKTPGAENAKKTLQANCKRRAALQQHPPSGSTEATPAAAAAAAAGKGGEGGPRHVDCSCEQQPYLFLPPGLHQQLQSQQRQWVHPSPHLKPLKQRLSAGLRRLFFSCLQGLSRVRGAGRSSQDKALQTFFLRGMPPSVRPFLWPQCLLMASQNSAYCSKETAAFCLGEKARGDRQQQPCQASSSNSSSSSSSSSSKYTRFLQALPETPAHAYYIFSREEFSLLQAKARSAGEHPQPLSLHHPGAAAAAAAAAAQETETSGDTSAAGSVCSPAVASVVERQEVQQAAAAKLAAAAGAADRMQATDACDPRACSSSSNASEGLSGYGADGQAFKEASASCNTSNANAKRLCSSTEHSSSSSTGHGSSSSSNSSKAAVSELAFRDKGICKETLAKGGSRHLNDSSVGPQGKPVPHTLREQQHRGHAGRQLETQQQQQRPLGASIAVLPACREKSSGVQPSPFPTNGKVQEGMQSFGGAAESAKAFQEETKNYFQFAIAAAATVAATPRARAHFRHLRNTLPRVYPQLQQLPQGYGALVLPECSAEQLMALVSPTANEPHNPHAAMGLATRLTLRCCSYGCRGAAASPSCCLPCNGSVSAMPHAGETLFPLPRCCCCQETVAAAFRTGVAEAEAAADGACSSTRASSSSSSAGSSSGNSSFSSAMLNASTSSSADGIATGLRTVMESLFLLLPDCGSVDGLAKVAAVLLYYLDSYTTLNFLLRLMSLPPFSGLLLLRPLARRSLREEVSCFRRLFVGALPALSAYFRGISLSPTLVLLPLAASLFLCALPVHVAVRVWDFLLLPCCQETDQHEKETDGLTLRLYQVVLGILKYHEAALLSSNLEGCTALLYTPPPPALFDSTRFFEVVEAMGLVNLSRARVSSLRKSCRRPT